MRPRLSAPLLLLSLVVFTPTLHAKDHPEDLAKKAVSADQKKSGPAIAELRSLGPAGLEAMFRVHAAEINKQISEPLTPTAREWERLSTALDAVSQQKNSYLSRIYWYTDLDQAKAAAKKSGKPIVSLRLLGNLNEEFSCANSRFFRTILYSNAEISKALRERFVLHWKSVRPAPHVTIDFGDGRKLERTLTGNSIHYILDEDGAPIDALPGLYGPAAFLRALGETEAVFAQLEKHGEIKLIQALWNYHRARLDRVNLNWFADIQKIGGKTPRDVVVVTRPDGTPEALQIASLAIAKAVTEATILRSLTGAPEALGAVTDEAAWKKIAQLHIADAQLDARSVGLIQRQTKKVLSAERSKTSDDEALASLVQQLQMNIALDTVRNEYLMRTRLHAWLIADRGRSDLETFNKKVYAELFLTPASDPWLGLFTADTYVALENGGVVR